MVVNGNYTQAFIVKLIFIKTFMTIFNLLFTVSTFKYKEKQVIDRRLQNLSCTNNFL